MKLLWTKLLLGLYFDGSVIQADTTCSPDPLQFHNTIGMQVKQLGNVPTKKTEASSYNMFPADNFSNNVFFLDQLLGIIYDYDDTSQSIKKLLDVETSDQIPD